jgi:hypothetical protein
MAMQRAIHCFQKFMKGGAPVGAKAIPAEEYVERLLKGKESITSEEMPFDSEFDYAMTCAITAEQNEESGYKVEFLGGNASKNGYTIPNMRIVKRNPEMGIYRKNGYESFEGCLRSLSDEYGCPLETVRDLAGLYGEDFDGLISHLSSR